MKPPSQILKAYDKLKDKDFSDAYINEMEKATLLPPEEVGYWLKHLKNIRRNRRRGTQKAAQTRRQKRGTRYFCSCGQEYLTITEDIEQWIGCDELIAGTIVSVLVQTRIQSLIVLFVQDVLIDKCSSKMYGV